MISREVVKSVPSPFIILLIILLVQLRFSKFKRYFDGFSPYSIHLVRDLTITPSILDLRQLTRLSCFSFSASTKILSPRAILSDKCLISFSILTSVSRAFLFFQIAYEIVLLVISNKSISKKTKLVIYNHVNIPGMYIL